MYKVVLGVFPGHTGFLFYRLKGVEGKKIASLLLLTPNHIVCHILTYILVFDPFG